MCPGECTCSTHLDPRPSCLSTQAVLHSEKWMEPRGHTNVQWPQRGFSSSTMATQAKLLPLSTLFGGDAHWPVDPPLTSRKSGPDKGVLRVYHSPNDPTEKWPSCNYFLCRTLSHRHCTKYKSSKGLHWDYTCSEGILNASSAPCIAPSQTPLLPSSHPCLPKLSVLEGPRAWHSAFSPVSPFFFPSSPLKFHLYANHSQICHHLSNCPNISNCQFSSDSRHSVSHLKRYGARGTNNHQELNTAVEGKMMEMVKRSVVAGSLGSGRDEQMICAQWVHREYAEEC